MRYERQSTIWSFLPFSFLVSFLIFLPTPTSITTTNFPFSNSPILMLFLSSPLKNQTSPLLLSWPLTFSYPGQSLAHNVFPFTFSAAFCCSFHSLSSLPVFLFILLYPFLTRKTTTVSSFTSFFPLSFN